ncbi:Hypothetical protein PFR_JS7-2_1457 [Propionibacterium freudenreichii]|nr:Hypothetical protein PFR_JS7-1_1457 [Propionibacterium freudenreichii]SCQ52584.1 Hypothetical protein PFR_JS7-2_1457 [Propionibacterium freudenreichii]
MVNRTVTVGTPAGMSRRTSSQWSGATTAARATSRTSSGRCPGRRPLTWNCTRNDGMGPIFLPATFMAPAIPVSGRSGSRIVAVGHGAVLGL